MGSLVDEVALGNTRTGFSSSTVSCRHQCTLCYHTMLAGVASLTWKLPAAVSHLHRGNKKKVDKLAFCNIFFNHEHTCASLLPIIGGICLVIAVRLPLPPQQHPLLFSVLSSRETKGRNVCVSLYLDAHGNFPTQCIQKLCSGERCGAPRTGNNLVDGAEVVNTLRILQT